MKDNSCKTPRWRILKAQLNNIAPEAFFQAMEQEQNYELIDVRTPGEFAHGHIPGAICIDYLAEDFWDRIETLSPEKSYFLYCRTGRRSLRACTLMRNGGFDNQRLFNLEGGFALWSEIFPDKIKSTR
jgi:rhodanese-related sulfurtransferase